MRDEFTPELVIRAYASGIFPMGDDHGPIKWYSPDPRCVIDLYDFHIPKRLARTYRKGIFDIKINSAWEAVMHKCAARESTWITEDIFRVYTQLHELGAAHSVEAYYDGKLAGGLYGVSLGGAFMGESMFHEVTDASKVCLVFLVEHLKERGFILLDSQFMTSHLGTFNAQLISKAEYLAMLRKALTIPAKFD